MSGFPALTLKLIKRGADHFCLLNLPQTVQAKDISLGQTSAAENKRVETHYTGRGILKIKQIKIMPFLPPPQTSFTVSYYLH